MRVLWITNIIFPAIAEKMNLPKVVFGGWMYSSAHRLIQQDANVNLAVATVYSGTTFVEQTIDGVCYFLLPSKDVATVRSSRSLEPYWKRVVDTFRPDLVHLHGTEYPHGLAFLRACPSVPAVASIQGLVSCYAQYYLAGMSAWDVLKSVTLRDVLRGTIWSDKKCFDRRGEVEVEIIRRLKHIIGRTSWDKAQALAINPDIEYHFCNETLRGAFYGKTWSYDSCEKHSIFISQAGYPIKGFHQLLKAMPHILRRFPDAKIYVAGGDVTKTNEGFKGRMLRTGYGRYIAQLIKCYGLEHKVIFTGVLDEEQMCQRYLQSNVFVCPSAIENSPNSLGEAQLLGVPCVASYVGGTMDMMVGCEHYLYRFEEVDMLAQKVCDAFESCRDVNVAMQRQALARHDGKTNAQRLLSIYNKLVE